MKRFLRRIWAGLSGRKADWKNKERFNPAWKNRIEVMSTFLDSEDKSVVDLGCGPMWLKEFLDPGVAYTGVDYVDRGPGSVVRDLNKGEFSEVDADVYFVSGCLEYIHDPAWLIRMICSHTEKCVLSYCDVGRFPDRKWRESLGWVNHLSKQEVIEMFRSHGFALCAENVSSLENQILVLAKEG